MKSHLIILTQPPYANTTSLEASELCLGLAAFEQNISLLFMDKALYQLLPQTPSTPGHKAFTAVYPGLIEHFDIKAIYADSDAAVLYNCTADRLILSPTWVPKTKLPALLQQHDIILTF